MAVRKKSLCPLFILSVVLLTESLSCMKAEEGKGFLYPNVSVIRVSFIRVRLYINSLVIMNAGRDQSVDGIVQATVACCIPRSGTLGDPFGKCPHFRDVQRVLVVYLANQVVPPHPDGRRNAGCCDCQTLSQTCVVEVSLVHPGICL